MHAAIPPGWHFGSFESSVLLFWFEVCCSCGLSVAARKFVLKIVIGCSEIRDVGVLSVDKAHGACRCLAMSKHVLGIHEGLRCLSTVLFP